MKNLYILFIFLFGFTFSNAQIVDIPDANFKNALVNTLCVASGFQESPEWDVDVNNDGEIQVSEAEAVVHLAVTNQNIDSLEGLEVFTGLKSFRCELNNIAELDMSNCPLLENLSCSLNLISLLNITQNPNLYYINCGSNELTEIDISQNVNLDEIIFYNNLLQDINISQNINLTRIQLSENELSSIDISQNIILTGCYVNNNNLNEIDLSQNILLRGLGIGDNNVSTLDVSNNPDLKLLTCQNNPIEGDLDLSHLNGGMYTLLFNNTLISGLNLKNGDNINLTRMWAQDNPNLTCIQVDDVDFANSQICESSSGWCKDETTVYSEDCNLGIEDVLQKQISIYPNPAKDVLYLYNESISEISTIKVYDILGEQVLQKNNPINQIDMSNLATGLLFVQIETDKGLVIKKIIKQ